MRASKTVNGVTTKYYTDDDGKVVCQSDGTDTLLFYYDRNESVVGFKYNDDNYFYVKNQQGDITDITNSNGEVVASYTYDPWGKVISVSGSNLEIANLNPFRYRSYYYDSDIEMYYLQSRYYDPEVGRFINCDDVNYIGLTASEISYNPFAYCENEPVNDSDPSGKVALLTCVLIGAGIGLLIGGASGAAISYWKYGYVKWKYVIIGSIFGVAVGAISGYGIGVAVGASASTTIGLSSQASYLAQNVSKLKFSNTIKGYAKTRKYYNYNSLIKQMIKSATPVRDGENALKWLIPGIINGTKGVWELVINPKTKVIYHFLFNSKR